MLGYRGFAATSRTVAVPTSCQLNHVLSFLPTAESGDTLSPHLASIDGAYFGLLHFCCATERRSEWFTVPRSEATAVERAATFLHWLKLGESTDEDPVSLAPIGSWTIEPKTIQRVCLSTEATKVVVVTGNMTWTQHSSRMNRADGKVR